MSRHSVEATKRVLERKIKRMEVKRDQLICKLIDKPMTHTKRFWTIHKIDQYQSLIILYKKCIEKGYRKSRGTN